MNTATTISNRIKSLIAYCGLTISDFARLRNTTDQNIHNKLRRNNWTVEDLKQSAAVLDAEMSIEFKLKTGENYKIF